MKLRGNDGQLWFLLLSVILSQVPSAENGFACLSNPCVHGVCLDDLNSTYFCYCIDGYTGIQCQTNWNECWSSPCQNGGVCIDGIAMFNCSCPPGFVGELCEEDVNECESNPCLNNGTCVDAANGYYCNCLAGYSGIHCEIDIAVCNSTNETRCSNGGICEEGPGDSFTCRCQPGWSGFLCDNEIDECLPAPCQNGAVCVDLHADYACACLFGFSGKNCEETIHLCRTNPCKNGALCLVEEGHNTCYCVPDFHGDLCQFQYDECQLGPRCMNGGTCIDGIDNFTCSCPPNLTGVLCECLILEENEFDCTYIAPKTTTTTTTTAIPSTTTEISTTIFETSIVPNLTTELTTSSSSELTTLTTTVSSISTESYLNFTIFGTDETIFTTTEIPSSTVTLFTTELIGTTFQNISTITLPWESTSTSTMISTETPTTTTFIPSSKTDVTVSTSPRMLDTSTSETTFSTIPMELTSESNYISTLTTKSFELTSTEIPTTEGQKDNVTRETTQTISTLFFTTTFPSHETTEYTSFPTTSTLLETTEIPTTFQPPILVDCSQSETQCQNGGTCVLTHLGHQCICPFDTEGLLCEIRLGIKKAAFTGDSYLSHRLLNVSHISFEFEAQTLANSGLLFYSTVDSTYMSLYLENGYLKFKFSCGYQTMLLSEVKVPVNNGYPINVKAKLEFSKDFKHCDATVKVNNTLSMTGDQIAVVEKYLKPVAWLYLGGIPSDIQNDNLLHSGFIGCMSNLKINEKRIDIFKEAEDGTQITECSSLVCLLNPCKNGGSCFSTGDQWECKCNNGFLGMMCEKSVCDNNPCLFGGTCIPFSNSGYICLCPYGKHGHFCENDLKVTEPYFSSSVRGYSSFVAYPLPEGIFQSMEIKFRFTPTNMEQISILLFIGQNGYHDFYSDHLAVSFVKGYIMLTWNLGSGPRRIFTAQPIKKGARDYLVRLGHFGRRAWLYVDNLGNVTGRAPGNLVQLDVVPLLFLGGHYTKNFSTLPHDLPLHTGFSGCIFDVEIKSGSIVFPLQGNRQTIGRAVGQCGTTECYEKSCQNDGACLHHGSTFMCLCQDGWYGPLCSSINNLCDFSWTQCAKESTCVPQLTHYQCDCPFGRTGKFCRSEENITDISLTGQRSYISLPSISFDNFKFNIEMEIRILHDQGIVFYIGKKDSNFICLSLQNGLLELRIKTGKSKLYSRTPLVIRSNKLLVKAVWHKVQFGLFGRKAYLSVDNIINTGLLPPGETVIVSKEIIYLGGTSDLSELPNSAISSLPVSYTGCIRHFSIDSVHITLTSDNILSSRNVIDCDGTPCGGDFCENGGTCWLDSFMIPHCSCVKPYYGNKCENIPTCNEKHCLNRGTCINSQCSCKMGFNGAFCETEITVKVPQFTGKSYLIVKNANDKKRNIRQMNLNKLYLNFTTTNPNGLLVWSEKDNSFIGVGIERGFLKITFSISNANKNYVEVPSLLQIADGLWHNLEITFAPFSVNLDKKVLKLPYKQDKQARNLIIFTNGIFYIGGFPQYQNSTLLNETYGMFLNTFEGCIEAFGTNSEIIRDFNHLEGENIEICKMF